MPRWIRWFWERFRQPVGTPRESDVVTDPAVASSRPPRRRRDANASMTGPGSETFVGRLSGDFSAEEEDGAERRRHGTSSAGEAPWK
ncbi:MAG: hypothetical protein GEV00_19520 [Actinophytocola sp.]|nr:hypothetical protein [Actinophytocola sp.]